MDLGDKTLQPLRVLGQGTFGRVFLCKCLQSRDPTYLCVKRIIVINPKTDMKMILEEVYIISQIKHPNIVQFMRSFVHAGTVNIVMEYVDGDTLRNAINKARHVAISLNSLMRYFCDILMGLEYLHIRHVIHRDLKPENLLLTAQRRVKIADFGISAVHTPNGKHQLKACGTPYYLAPEVMRGKKYDFKSDVWSLGCVLYELCLAEHPFAEAKSMAELRFLVRLRTSQRMDCSGIAARYGNVWRHLCEQMLIYEVEQRIALPDILTLDGSLTIPFYKNYFDYAY